jgi:hypothetical protein
MKLARRKTRLLAAKVMGAARVRMPFDVMLHAMAGLTSGANRRLKFQNDAG